MISLVKFGGLWQGWNVTCDGSIIVENGHRNMGFYELPSDSRTKLFIERLKFCKPVFSLSRDYSLVVSDSDLRINPNGFHVFDYAQLEDEKIDIRFYIE